MFLMNVLKTMSSIWLNADQLCKPNITSCNRHIALFRCYAKSIWYSVTYSYILKISIPSLYLNHCYLYHFHTRKWWVVTYFLKVCFILRTTLCLGTAVFHFTYVECKHSLQFYTHRMVAKVSQFCVLIFK